VKVAIAIAVVCGLSSGYIDSAWSGDLEAALENINISSDAESAPKKLGNNSLPCTNVSDAHCAGPQDDVSAAANGAASAIRDSIVISRIPSITVNGTAVETISHQSTVAAGGF
jgi:hypothetical protein